MRKNKIKELIKAGKPVINGWLQIPHSYASEVMAKQGYDSLTVDLQHGVVDYPNALQMFQAISTTDVVPMARVNWNEPGQIMKILDAGAYGIICPMVSNKKEAENFVKACMYPPKGFRSFSLWLFYPVHDGSPNQIAFLLSEGHPGLKPQTYQ